MFSLCVWMNIPSHYQSAFFEALDPRPEIDLKVVYLNGASNARAAEGWRDTHDYQPYEKNAEGMDLVENIDSMVPDWKDRTHLICGYFSADLIDLFCHEHIAWCHWSEMPGIRLAEALGYRTPLFRLLNPMMQVFKNKDGRRIRDHALGAFGQGVLARKAFRRMGVPDNRISDLYYVPNGLEPLSPSEKVVQFAAGRRVFLAVGALCRRKGIDVLLNAFARLRNKDWCLVLCGLDRSEGFYETQCRKLGIQDQVCFLGAYPSERIAEVYTASDVFVLASRFDGWGAVLNEAASLGLPLIGTDLCGASWHVINHGRNGYRVRAASAGSLAEALGTYAANPELCTEYGAVSRSMFRDTFTPEANAKRLIEALKSWRPA